METEREREMKYFAQVVQEIAKNTRTIEWEDDSQTP